MRWRSRPKIACAGRVIADRYRLEAPLGRGAMGEIWSAEHVRLKSRVAIKFLDAAIADDPEMLDRFLREAQSAAAVRSAHVVQIFDCGVERGAPYISMELLQGDSLDARLYAQGRLTPSELDKVFSEVAVAIGNAHKVGVIHRDLKPGNIFIAREGDLEITKVLDFGIAKVMSHTLRLSTGMGTRTGTLLGTPNYMSPEQCRGARDLDQSTDLWSLAIIAFECLTGHQPFPGQSIGDVVVQICTEAPLVPSSLADVPAGFDEWFLKGASKQASERFASAREMAQALSVILRHEGVPATVNIGSSPETGEPMTLHSRTEPPLPRLPEAASPSVSAASLAVVASAALGASSSLASGGASPSGTSPSGTFPAQERPVEIGGPGAPDQRPGAGALLRAAVEMLRALRLSLVLSWLQRERAWLVPALRSPARLRDALQRTFAPLVAERRHPERLAISLSLSLLCGSVLMALWYGAVQRTPALSRDESVTAAAPLSQDGFELQAVPLPQAAPGDADGKGVSAPADPVAADLAAEEPDVAPATARELRRVQVPASPARATTLKARPNAERPAAQPAIAPAPVPTSAPTPAPPPSRPSKRSVQDPFAERL